MRRIRQLLAEARHEPLALAEPDAQAFVVVIGDLAIELGGIETVMPQAMLLGGNGDSLGRMGVDARHGRHRAPDGWRYG